MIVIGYFSIHELRIFFYRGVSGAAASALSTIQLVWRSTVRYPISGVRTEPPGRQTVFTRFKCPEWPLQVV